MYQDKIIQITTHEGNLIALSSDGYIYSWTNKQWYQLPSPVKKKWSKNCPQCKERLPKHAPWHAEQLKK